MSSVLLVAVQIVVLYLLLHVLIPAARRLVPPGGRVIIPTSAGRA